MNFNVHSYSELRNFMAGNFRSLMMPDDKFSSKYEVSSPTWISEDGEIDTFRSSPALGMAHKVTEGKYSYRGIFVDGYRRDKGHFADFLLRGTYKYLHVLAKKGRMDIIDSCIDLCGDDFEKTLNEIARYSIMLHTKREDYWEELDYYLMNECLTIAAISFWNEPLRKYIVSVGSKKFPEVISTVDKIYASRVDDPNADPPRNMARLIYSLVSSFISDYDSRKDTERMHFTTIYAIYVQDDDDCYGSIPFQITLEFSAKSYRSSFTAGLPDFHLHFASQDFRKAFSKITKGYITDFAEDMENSKDNELELSNLSTDLAMFRMKKYAKYLDVELDDLADRFLDMAEDMFEYTYYANEMVGLLCGTELLWMVDTNHPVRDAIDFILNDPFYKLNYPSATELITDIVGRYIIRKCDFMYDSDIEINTKFDLMKKIVPYDDEELLKEINDIGHILMNSVLFLYVSDCRGRLLSAAGNEKTVKDTDRYSSFHETISAQKRDIENLENENASLKAEIEKLKSTRRDADQTVRHNSMSSVQKRLENAESGLRKYQELYNESQKYIELLETPAAVIHAVPDAEKLAVERLGGKRFLFVASNASKNVPDAKKNFPRSVFCESETDNMSGLKLDGIIIMTKYISHSIFYKYLKYKDEQYSDIPVLMFNQRNADLLYSAMLEEFDAVQEKKDAATA